MKKLRLFTLLTLMATIALLILVGCKKEDKVISISFKDHDPNIAVEMAAGEFDCSAYTVVVTYQSGSTEEIALTKEMIAETDMLKLYQVGEHDITVSYGEFQYTFKVSVKRSTFGNLAFPQNNVFTYDGKAHTVEVDGNIPANAVITYPEGNSFVNAGTYDVTAIVSCDGYVTERLATTVTIARAKYDMSGVRFEGKEVVYDGNSHSVAISGTLPEGVSAPIYTIDEKITASATDVGEYRVKATFANNDPNYEPILPMEAILKITPAEYSVTGVDIVFRDENGNILSDATKTYDGKGVRFDLNDYNKLSKKVSVSFSVLDKDGNLLSTSNTTTNMINAGVYTVKVEFTLTDGKNYQAIAPLVRTFEILKAEHPSIENVRFASSQVTYDGKGHSIVIEGQLPEGVTVSYEYYRNNILVVDSEGKPLLAVMDAGIYTVKAVFTHQDENLEKISDMVATLTIKKAMLDPHLVGFFGENSVTYSGQAYEPIFTKWKDASEVDYDILQYSTVKYYVFDATAGTYVEMGENELPTNPGSYRAAIDVSIAEEYKGKYVWAGDAEVQTFVKQFEILKQAIDLPSVQFTSVAQWEYTEEAEEIEYTHNADLELVTVSTAYFKYVSGEYVAMNNGELPINKGFYKFVVTVTVNDETRYVFSDGATSEAFSFEFEILPITIDVSGITLSNTSVMYNEENQMPTLENVPMHVEATMKCYSSDGRTQLNEVINAGTYRCEVVLSADSPNYRLSSTEMLEFEFEILPIPIKVDGLTFDTLSFSYDGSSHLPNLNAPDHVTVKGNLFLINPISSEETYVEAAIKAGTYKYEVWLTAESLNYVLSGQTDYSTEFEIKTAGIVIADIDELLEQSDFYVELPYGDGTYNYDDDDPVYMNAVLVALFGDNSDLVKFNSETTGTFTDTVTGKVLHDMVGMDITADRIYTLACRLAVTDPNQYGFFHHNNYVKEATVTFKVMFINNNA